MGAGTLLVYDEAFPRAKVAGSGAAIRNTPSDAELRDNKYPEPYRLLAVKEADGPEAYFQAMADAAKAMGQLARLIILGHGRVVSAAAEADDIVKVTIGIIIGAQDITADNAKGLRKLRGVFTKQAQAELWVCQAADKGGSTTSGVTLCQSMADALQVTVLAAEIKQQYTTENQQQTPEGGWQSTMKFLPWEGTPLRFAPRAGK